MEVRVGNGYLVAREGPHHNVGLPAARACGHILNGAASLNAEPGIEVVLLDRRTSLVESIHLEGSGIDYQAVFKERGLDATIEAFAADML